MEVSATPIVVDLADINNISDLTDFSFIEKAFGRDSLGLIIVKNIPEFVHLRKNLLQAGRNFVLNVEDKTKYEVPDAYYAVGWSHGKEKMKNNQADFVKGSYYANPLFDNPTSDASLIKKYPGSYHPNVWPQENTDFETSFKSLGSTVCGIGKALLKCCDGYLKSKGQTTNLSEIIGKDTSKGRFLHYFATEKAKNKEEDGACGWHCDSGGLTGLISASYFDDKTQEEISKPDNCGLFVKDRKNNLIKVSIPKDCMAFQIGEIVQILSGGELIATPHAVKSTNKLNVSRNTLAVFMDPNPLFEIRIPDHVSDKSSVVNIKNLPEGVPQMEDRYFEGINFGQFLDNTYKAYYN